MNPLFHASRGALRALFSLSLLAALAGCGRAGEYDAAALAAMRSEKDLALRAADSPVPDSLRASFPGLAYFPPNPGLVFELPLERFERPEVIKVTATGGDVRMMTRYGRFVFEVEGVRCSLSVFKSDPSAPHLFLPFRDATNGEETYEVGRYIDLEEKEAGEPYLLDFNLCYNPYCAYNASYTCPLVPFENILPVAIRAGEKVPEWAAH